VDLYDDSNGDTNSNIITGESTEYILEENLNDVNSEIAAKLIETYIGDEIKSVCNNCKQYGITAVSSKSLNTLIYKLNNSYYNIIKDFDIVQQQLYLMHQICRGLYTFNNNWVNLSYIKYRSIILFPNLIYMIVKYFGKAQQFLRKTIQKIYSEYKLYNYGIIQKYTQSYHLDDQVIQHNILCYFLGNALRKYDPLQIKKPLIFYRQIFRSSYYYYFKSKQDFDANYYEVDESEFLISKAYNVPAELKIYREVLYRLQINKIIKDTPIMIQINYNYNIFKNVIVNNEFQNMYSNLISDVSSYNNNHFNLLNIYKDQITNKQNSFLEKLQKLPIIYKLLKCIHIYNKSLPHNPSVIKPQTVKTIILEELMYPFKNLFSEQYAYHILESIAENFVDNILTGEYINPITFSTYKIQDYSFIFQLKEFIRLCIGYKKNTEDT